MIISVMRIIFTITTIGKIMATVISITLLKNQRKLHNIDNNHRSDCFGK